MTKYFVAIRTKKYGEILGQRAFSSPSKVLRAINSKGGQATFKKYKAIGSAIISKN